MFSNPTTVTGMKRQRTEDKPPSTDTRRKGVGSGEDVEDQSNISLRSAVSTLLDSAWSLDKLRRACRMFDGVDDEQASRETWRDEAAEHLWAAIQTRTKQDIIPSLPRVLSSIILERAVDFDLESLLKLMLVSKGWNTMVRAFLGGPFVCAIHLAVDPFGGHGQSVLAAAVGGVDDDGVRMRLFPSLRSVFLQSFTDLRLGGIAEQLSALLSSTPLLDLSVRVTNDDDCIRDVQWLLPSSDEPQHPCVPATMGSLETLFLYNLGTPTLFDNVSRLTSLKALHVTGPSPDTPLSVPVHALAAALASLTNLKLLELVDVEVDFFSCVLLTTRMHHRTNPSLASGEIGHARNADNGNSSTQDRNGTTITNTDNGNNDSSCNNANNANNANNGGVPVPSPRFTQTLTHLRLERLPPCVNDVIDHVSKENLLSNLQWLYLWLWDLTPDAIVKAVAPLDKLQRLDLSVACLSDVEQSLTHVSSPQQCPLPLLQEINLINPAFSPELELDVGEMGGQGMQMTIHTLDGGSMEGIASASSRKHVTMQALHQFERDGCEVSICDPDSSWDFHDIASDLNLGCYWDDRVWRAGDHANERRPKQ